MIMKHSFFQKHNMRFEKSVCAECLSATVQVEKQSSLTWDVLGLYQCVKTPPPVSSQVPVCFELSSESKHRHIGGRKAGFTRCWTQFTNNRSRGACTLCGSLPISLRMGTRAVASRRPCLGRNVWQAHCVHSAPKHSLVCIRI